MLPYVSRDVATEPPTTVVIVSTGGSPPELVNNEETVFAITEDCIEPTEGWMNREGKPFLTICFMHSFGKCAGRTNSDPRSCFQIHVKPAVLNALRRHYSNPTRRYFTRTVKGQLSPELRYQLSVKAHKELKVQYLEYRVQDTYPSAGLLQYEAAYRRWLFSESQSTESAANITVMQCTLFASTGMCPSGTECPFIHAHPKNAQVRDPVLGRALRELCDGPTCAVWGNSTGSKTSASSGRGGENPVGVVAASVPIYTLLGKPDDVNSPRLVPVQYSQVQDGASLMNYDTNKTSTSGNHASSSSPKSTQSSHGRGKQASGTSYKFDTDGWASANSNEGISSSNQQTGSSRSGSD